MTIGIDINEANVTHRVGSNQYAYEIIKALYTQNDGVNYILYSSSPLVADLPKERVNWHYKIIPPAKLWTQWRLPLELWRDRKILDVFFTPGHYAPRWCPVPSVVTVMDLAFIDMKGYFKAKDYWQLKNWTAYSVRQANKVIAISESTKADVVKYYHRDPKDVVVAYPGFSPPPASGSNLSIINHQSLSLPYILFVGTLQPRKNLVRLIKAFEKLESDVDLVIAGKRGWLADEIFKTITDSPKKDRIKVLGFVATDDLPSLFAHSICVVMPGINEGFGLPALEAIHYDTLPLVANSGSLPEIVGESSLTFDPLVIDSICASLQKAIQLPKAERQQLLSSLKTHAKKFSWEESAKSIRKVFDEISV